MKTLLGEVKALADEARDRTRHEAAKTAVQLNFVRGYQWHPQGSPAWFQNTESHPDVETPSRNMVRRLLSAYAAMVTSSVTDFEVTPRSPNSMARYQAHATGKIVHALWRDDGDYFPLADRVNAVFLAAVTGGAWVKVGYDPQRRPLPGGEVEGDIDVQVLARSEVHPDPAARREEDMSYLFHTVTIPVATAMSRYPVDVFGRPTDGSAFERLTDDELYMQHLATGYDHELGWGSTDWAVSRNYLVEITHCWWKPGRHFPNGLFLAYSGERVLAMGPLPYEFPWVFVPGPNRVPWSLYPDGLLMDLERTQRDMNEVSGRIMEWIKLCSAPTLLTHVDNTIDEDEFTNLAGAIVRYAGNRPPPTWNSPPAPPGQLFDAEGRLLDLMKQQAAISDINLGSVPTDDFSGRAVAILEDLQRSSHGEAFSSYQRVTVKILRKMLAIAQSFWPEGKTLLAAGGSSTDVAVFRRAEFDPAALISVKSGGAPKSRMAARAERLELFAAGAYDDTPAAEKLRADLAMGGERSNEELHHQKALAENVALFEGGHQPEVDVFDDHEIHYHEHERALLTESDPELKRRMAEHMLVHQQAMLEAMAAMAPSGDPAAPSGGGSLPPPPADLPLGEEAARASDTGRGAESPMGGGIGDLEAMSSTGRRPGPT